jgi:hypothetical protein
MVSEPDWTGRQVTSADILVEKSLRPVSDMMIDCLVRWIWFGFLQDSESSFLVFECLMIMDVKS